MYLLFEYVIDLFLIHLPLLLAGEADTASKLLVFSLDALSDGLTRFVPQESDHLPAREILDHIFLEAQILQLLLDVLLRKFSQIGICASYSLWVLDCWVKIHSVNLSLVQ